MTIIRDIVSDFSDEEDIEICSDDEDVEFDVESRPDRYVGRCKHFGARCVHDIWEIKKISGTHSCVSTLVSQYDNKIISSFISDLIVKLVSADSSIRVKALVKEVVIRSGYTVAYRNTWIAKQRALTQIYEFLGLSNHELKGFAYCKPILQVDDTFLTKKYTGTLLLASSQDENICVFPLAFTIVEVETKKLGNDSFLIFELMLPINQIYVSYQIGLTKVIRENQRQSICQLVRPFSRETRVFEVEVASRFGGRQVGFDYREFQSLRLSCSHAIATCASLALDCGQFMSPIYQLDNLLKECGYEFQPIGPTFIPNPFNLNKLKNVDGVELRGITERHVHCDLESW
ncbi:hypothetical protein Lal_00017847, partial [Lupinus albus]